MTSGQLIKASIALLLISNSQSAYKQSNSICVIWLEKRWWWSNILLDDERGTEREGEGETTTRTTSTTTLSGIRKRTEKQQHTAVAINFAFPVSALVRSLFFHFSWTVCVYCRLHYLIRFNCLTATSSLLCLLGFFLSPLLLLLTLVCKDHIIAHTHTHILVNRHIL